MATQSVKKPRVFLSYADADSAFVDRVERDLKKFQILLWRDKSDIRDGRSWMNSIFAEGLRDCDLLLAYFTERALKSKMMKREVEAAVIRNTQEPTFVILPYVCSPGVRQKLRSDFQTLQCREWNEENYDELLPSVVGEIWQCFAERTATNERARSSKEKRTNVAVENHGNKSIFTAKEEREFSYLRDRLDEPIETSAKVANENSANIQPTKGKTRHWRVSISPLYLLLWCYWFDPLYCSQDSDSRDNLVAESKEWNQVAFDSCSIFDFNDLIPTFIKLELVSPNSGDFFRHKYTKKMHRFKYWIEFNLIEPSNPTCSYRDWDSKNHRWLE